MVELIRKPSTRMDRRLVHAAVVRLAQHPGTISVETVMRMVDEYAASQHTELVYRHAERIVAETLVEAHRGMDSGKKIFICEDPEFHEKIFFDEKIFESPKKIFKWPSAPADSPKMIMVRDLGTNGDTNNQTKVGTNRVPTVTPAPDTSDKGALATPATDTRDAVTPATDAPDKDALATVPSDSEPTVTGVTDKDALATQDCDTSDTMDREPTDGVLTVRVPTDENVDNPGCAEGEKNSHTPDASKGLTDGEKTCTRCGQRKARGEFSRNRSRADGFASACRVCENERDRIRRADKQRAKKAREGGL